MRRLTGRSSFHRGRIGGSFLLPGSWGEGNTGPEISASGPQKAVWRSRRESASPGPTGPPQDGCPVGQVGAFAPPTLKGHPLKLAAAGQAKLEPGRASMGAVWPPFPAAPYAPSPARDSPRSQGQQGRAGLKSPPQELWVPGGLQAGRPPRVAGELAVPGGAPGHAERGDHSLRCRCPGSAA